jgi:glycopeptide antibiotics resistance protein
MGKRDVRVIGVPKWLTALLLVATTAAMIALLWALSGRAYASRTHSAAAVARTIAHAAEVPHAMLIADLMPVAANVILFVPWGFFTFVLLDRPSRSRATTYAMTLAAAVVFAAAIELWQSSLPARVTTLFDSAANVLGALLGSMAGHLRKQVRVRFQV